MLLDWSTAMGVESDPVTRSPSCTPPACLRQRALSHGKGGYEYHAHYNMVSLVCWAMQQQQQCMAEAVTMPATNENVSVKTW